MIRFDNFQIWQNAMTLVMLASFTMLHMLGVTAIVGLRACRFSHLLSRTPMLVVPSKVSLVLAACTK